MPKWIWWTAGTLLVLASIYYAYTWLKKDEVVGTGNGMVVVKKTESTTSTSPGNVVAQPGPGGMVATGT